ncbi:MAG: bifunctional histidinol-phosphatase/imidazoleglycerol-phosphate dehydratase HisB [Lysobacteraceae bacterium]
MKRYLFIDRDGTLIREPADFQIDAYDKLALVDGVIPALLKLQSAGYRLVMVSNQDGLGTESFPREQFDGPHRLLQQILTSQGIHFEAEHIDESLEGESRMVDGTPTRKPGIGMLLPYLRDRDVDMAGSWVIGDRDTDLQLAANLGCAGLKIGMDGLDWPGIVTRILGRPRFAERRRETRETRIVASVDLDAARRPEIRTGIGFFDHMLEQIGTHGGFALELRCEGDLEVDEHHTVEDCAIVLGEALREALGDKRGIVRYGVDDVATPARLLGQVAIPMDESLAVAAIDLSGRGVFVFDGRFSRERVGELSTEMVEHFFRSLSAAAGMALHLKVTGENAHHQVEGCFKAVARALRQAISRNSADGSQPPSSKGTL